MEQNLDQLTKRKETLAKEVDAMEKSVNDQKLIRDGVVADIEAKQKEAKDLETQIAKLEQDAQSARENGEAVSKDIQDKITSLNDDLVAVYEKLEKANSDLSTINGDIESARTELANVRQELEDARSDQATFVAQSNEEKNRLKADIDALSNSLAQYSESNQRAIDIGKEAEAKAEAATTRLASVTEETARAEEKLGQITSDTEKAVEERTEKITALDRDYAEKKASKDAEVTRLDGEIKEKTDELDSKKAQAVSLATRKDELDQRESFLRERYAAAGLQW